MVIRDEGYDYSSNSNVDGSHMRHSNRKLHGFKAFENKVVSYVDKVEKKCPACLPVVGIGAVILLYFFVFKRPPTSSEI